METIAPADTCPYRNAHGNQLWSAIKGPGSAEGAISLQGQMNWFGATRRFGCTPSRRASNRSILATASLSDDPHASVGRRTFNLAEG